MSSSQQQQQQQQHHDHHHSFTTTTITTASCRDHHYQRPLLFFYRYYYYHYHHHYYQRVYELGVELTNPLVEGQTPARFALLRFSRVSLARLYTALDYYYVFCDKRRSRATLQLARWIAFVVLAINGAREITSPPPADTDNARHRRSKCHACQTIRRTLRCFSRN